ncbi:hypothetical protein EDD11_002524 [Mortierella claussenii]|nr:hypothetical protein EDD11_002524 [Mortierella claussenii]
MTIFTNAKLNLDVESIVYPQYDTRGDFTAAVKTLADWTQQQVKSREVFNLRAYGQQKKDGDEQGTDKVTEKQKGEANTEGQDSFAAPMATEQQETQERIPPVYVCFIGHSMGGLVAADAALLLHAATKKSPVIGILAFDTPYFGLNHTIFTQAAYERVNGLAQKASGAYSLVTSYLPAAAAWNAVTPGGSSTEKISSSSGSRLGDNTREQQEKKSTASSGFNPSSLWSGTSANVAKKETSVTTTSSSTSSGSKWSWGSIALGVGAAVVATGAAVVVNNHMNKGMEVTAVLELPIGFHCFYTQVQIPASASNNWRSGSRTFVELSSIPSATLSSFSPRQCSGQDEIEAHMEMFNPSKNFDYYQMGDETVTRIKSMVDAALARDIKLLTL